LCRDDLNLDDRKELTQAPEDQWFSKEKLYKVRSPKNQILEDLNFLLLSFV
jgi:hypothetical protein